MIKEQKWSFSKRFTSISDKGHFYRYVQFTNGKDTLQTSGDELSDEQLQQFCDLLNCMPDLFSYKCNRTQSMLAQKSKKVKHFENALKAIKDVFYTDEETDKDKIDELKAIAFNALNEVE